MALTDPLIIVILAVTACLLSAGVTALMVRVAVLDRPNSRSSHETPVPRAGGLGIAAACLAAWATYLIAGPAAGSDSVIWGLVAGAVAVSLTGLLDDLSLATGFRTKLLAQLLGAVAVVAGGVMSGALPIGGSWASIAVGWQAVLAVLWIVGLTNAFNFMDGLDGLAAGTAMAAGASFAVIALPAGQIFVFVTGLAIAAAAFGFLFFNRPPARIFMGDVGSQLLGFLFAALAIVAARGEVPSVTPLLVPLLLFHFLFDAAFTLVRRLVSGQRVTEAHRAHLYQILNQLGVSHLGVSAVHGGFAAVLGAAGIWLAGLPLSDQWWVFVPFLVVEAAYAATLLALARRRGLKLG